VKRPAVGLLLLAVLAIIARQVELTNDLARLLPADGDLPAAVEALERFQVADTLLIEVDGTGVEKSELFEATDALGERLREDPLFGSVRYRVEVDDGLALQSAALPHAVALIPAEELEDRLSEEGLRQAMRKQLARLYGPGGSMFEGAIRQDPLDLGGLALEQVRGAGGPFAMTVQGGHFLDRAGERALIVAQPTVPALGMGPDHPLIESLHAALSESPLPARYLGGHRMAYEASALIHEDVRRALTLGSVLLVLLFLVGFRSFRPIFGSLSSTAMAAAAAGAVAALLSPIHGISMGFAAALLGLAVDYWVHLYVAAANLQPAQGFRERLERGRTALRQITPALLLGAGSTMGACCVLLLSRYPVVRDLGAMGIAASGGALAGTFLLGPTAYAIFGSKPLPGLPLARAGRGLRLAVLGVAGLALALTTASTFNGDPRDLSPVTPETRALEAELSARYGGFGTGGMVALHGEDAEAARDAAVLVTHALERLPGVDVVGPAAVLPGRATRADRYAALPDAETLQARIDAAAAEVGFTPELFAGLGDRIHHGPADLPGDTWVGTPVEKLGQHLDGDAAMLSVVLADDSLTEAVEATVRATWPDASFVMPGRFATQGVEDIVRELLRLGGLALAGVALILALRYRDPRKVIAAMAPCLVAAVWALGAMALTGTAWNAVSACGMILILGLGLDYGVFMVESKRRDHTAYAVLMSAGTTAVGFGILIVTRSPALYGVGLAVLIGVIGALTSGLTLTPALASGEALVSERVGRWARRLALVAVVGVNVDLLAQQLWYLAPPPSQEAPTWTLEEPTPGDRRFGPHRLLAAEGVHTQYTVGGAYERGWAGAVLSPDLRKRLEDQTLAAFYHSVPNPLGRYLLLRGTGLWAPRLDQHLAAHHLEEIAGSVDAGDDHFAMLGPAYTRKVYYHALHDFGQAYLDTPFVVGCTGFIASPESTTGSWILARNFDFDGGPVFDRDKVVSFVVPDEGHAFVSVTFTGFIGVVTGMNDQRIAVAINASGSDDPPVAATPMTMVIREILESASSLDDAERILAERRGFVSENVMVVDGHAGEAALFEVSPSRIERVDVDGDLGVANHFRSPAFADDEATAWRLEEITTRYRQARVDELLDEHRGSLDLQTAVDILRDRRGPGGQELPAGHRHAIDADIATHSVVMDVTQGIVWVSRYPNTAGGYVAYDLDAGLAGEITPVEVVPPHDVRRTVDIHRGRKILDEEEGVDAARRALLLMPGHPQALMELGEALVDEGRCDEALEPLQRALATPPEYAEHVRRIEEALSTCS